MATSTQSTRTKAQSEKITKIALYLTHFNMPLCDAVQAAQTIVLLVK